ncbi:MAG: DUF4139 domain-containing protein [Chloroflexota bacterium]|nr:DUF4139 domain-containing protein [Chloroflexota bacterium]
MKSKLLFLPFALAIVVIALLGAVALTRTTPAQAQDAPPASDALSLTVYNQGTALVRDRRTFELQQGISTLDFTDVASQIDPTSVSFTSLTDPDGTSVLEQNYVFDLVGSSALLQRYIDQTIVVITTDGTTYRGQLLNGSGEIILRDESGQVIVIARDNVRDIRFPNLPGGLLTRPTLRWLLDSAAGGDQQIEITYLTGGVTWTADYILLLGAENTSLDLNGWITLTNSSGAGYENAQVKLVAGDVNRLPDPTMRGEMAVMDAMVPTAPSAAVEQREFYEYQLYEIARPVTVGNNETKQVEFVSGAGVPAITFYVYEGAGPFYGYFGAITDQFYMQTGITDVQNYLEFTTGEDGGLGADLPAGRVRVYQEDIDGAALLIGENRIDHTPQGESVRIYLGNAFDLVGERRQTAFNIISSNVIEETFEIRLRNRKDDETVEIRVPEHLYRWSEWEIVNSSLSFTELNSSTIEFRAMVEPGAEVIIAYTVRYTFP